MSSPKVQPALIAGVAIGVLSALPVINVVNFCCCAWVIFGGALSAWLMRQTPAARLTAGDGALVGLMAGAIGAIVGSLLSIPISLAMGPYQLQMLERLMQGAQDMPPEVRAIFEQMRSGAMSGAMVGISFFFGLIFSLFFYAIFGALGGLIGALLFRQDTPPPPPPTVPYEGFEAPPPPPPSLPTVG